MEHKEFHEIYGRAVNYGLSIPEIELVKNVRFEDEQRFRETLKQVTYLCPECCKLHSFSQNDVDTLIRLSLGKSLGRVGFRTICPSTEVLLDIDLNAREKNSISTPIYEVKKENIKIRARSLERLAFESEDFSLLSAERLIRIVSYHEERVNPHSRIVLDKALEQLQLRTLEAPKPQIEAKPTIKKKGFLSRVLAKFGRH